MASNGAKPASKARRQRWLVKRPSASAGPMYPKYEGPFSYSPDVARRWTQASVEWSRGHVLPMAQWLLNDEEIGLPDDARFFLFDLVLGRVQRPRHRPHKRTALEELRIMGDVFTERERLEANPRVLRPLDRAYETVAARRKLSVATVKGVYEKVIAELDRTTREILSR